MRYYAKYDDNGKLIAVGCGNGGKEISKTEHDAMMVDIKAKSVLAEQLHNGTIALEDIPEGWRDEILHRADEYAKHEGNE